MFIFVSNSTRLTMVNDLSQYKLFGSSKRGTAEVERKIEDILVEMQTPENLNKFASAISPQMKKSSARIMDFSKFEEKLNKAKSECFL